MSKDMLTIHCTRISWSAATAWSNAGPSRPALALAAEPGYGPGLAPSDRPGHYTGLAASDMNKLYAATIGPDGQQAWQDQARTRVRVGPGPNLKFTAWLTCSHWPARRDELRRPAASVCRGRGRCCSDRTQISFQLELRNFKLKLCWTRLRSMPSLLR